MTGNTHQPRNYISSECIAELLHHILKVNLTGSIQIESSNHAPREPFPCLNHSQLNKHLTIPPFFTVQLLQGKNNAEKIKGIIVSDNWLTYIHKPCHPIPNCKVYQKMRSPHSHGILNCFIPNTVLELCTKKTVLPT